MWSGMREGGVRRSATFRLLNLMALIYPELILARRPWFESEGPKADIFASFASLRLPGRLQALFLCINLKQVWDCQDLDLKVFRIVLRLIWKSVVRSYMFFDIMECNELILGTTWKLIKTQTSWLGKWTLCTLMIWGFIFDQHHHHHRLHHHSIMRTSKLNAMTYLGARDSQFNALQLVQDYWRHPPDKSHVLLDASP